MIYPFLEFCLQVGVVVGQVGFDVKSLGSSICFWI